MIARWPRLKLAVSQEWAYPWPSIVYFRVDVGLSWRFESRGRWDNRYYKERRLRVVESAIAARLNLLFPCSSLYSYRLRWFELTAILVNVFLNARYCCRSSELSAKYGGPISSLRHSLSSDILALNARDGATRRVRLFRISRGHLGSCAVLTRTGRRARGTWIITREDCDSHDNCLSCYIRTYVSIK